ncbi:MAG: hypothetical protein KJO09_08800 [Gammaproteobacteria bacterium]|nr:hypothetical protein [Gammaproteobacteria bacterium]
MKNLIIGAVLLAAVGYGGSKLLLHNKVENSVDQAVLMMSPFVNVKYDGVSSTMGGELTVDTIEAQINDFSDPITIDRLGIDTPSYFSLLNLADMADNVGNPDDVIPEYFGFIAEGIRMRVDADYFRFMHTQLQNVVSETDVDEPAAVCTGKYGFSPATLEALGYSEQVVSVAAYFRREPSNYTVSVTSSVEDMWSINAEVTLAGNMIAELSQGPRARPRLSALRIEYVDESLNQRVADYCGRLGLSGEEIVAAQLDKLAQIGSSLGIEFDEYVIDPFTDFVGGKSRLVITAKPVEPISLSQIGLYKASDVPALLDLSAEAF